MHLSNLHYWPFFVVAFAALVYLSIRSWHNSSALNPWERILAVSLRGIAILLILFAIADPQIIGERPVKGENMVAILTDNGAGMRVKDTGEILDRGEGLRQHLTGRDSTWIADLRDDFQIREYLFDTHLRRSNGFSLLDFSGKQSNLGEALNDLSSRLSNKPVAGIVVFTDGVSTDGQLLDSDYSKLPPIYPVIVGKDNEVPDLSIQNVKVTQSSFSDSPLKVEARISQSALKDLSASTQLKRIAFDQSVSVSDLAMQGSFIEEKRSILNSQDETVAFEWTNREGGIQFFELTTSILEDERGETIQANNRRLIAVDSGEENYRILYVTGRPNWEYKFLNRSLSVDPQLDIVGLIRVASQEPKFEFKGRAGENSNTLYRGFGREDETERYDEAVLIRMNTRDEKELLTGFPKVAEELYEYDAILIDDLEADFFSFSQQTLIRDFVKQRGGGLLMLGGVNALEDGGYGDTPIAQAMPVYMDSYGDSLPREQFVQWDLTRDGWVEPWARIRSLETQERRRIQEMPAFQVYNTFDRIKPGAQSLATIQDPSARTLPALVTQRYGSGRVATLAVGDLWRWGMQDSSSQADLAQFWRQLSRWLVTDNPRLVELESRKVKESTILLTAVARERDYRPLQSGTATLSIRRADTDDYNKSYTMNPSVERSGYFEFEVPLSVEGAFLAEVKIYSPDGSLVGEDETAWVHEPLVTEFASLSPNRTYLQNIAAKTGGAVVELSGLGKLGEMLNAQAAPRMETWSKPAWHNNWLFVLALGSLLAEWLLRRRRGLA